MVKSGSGEGAAPAQPFPPCLYIVIYSGFFLSLSEKPPQDAAEDNPSFLPHSSSSCFFLFYYYSYYVVIIIIGYMQSPVSCSYTIGRVHPLLI